MKRGNKREKNVEEFVLRHMGLFKAPQEEMDLAEARIQERLRTPPATSEGPPVDFGAPGRTWRSTRLALAFGAVAAVVVLGVFLQMPREIDVHAVVAEGALSRVSGGKTQVVRTGERIEAGEILRTNDANSSITLADSSRVEMRSHSEFSVERAEDGVRIHLFKGGLIINAAKQVAGRLYVQTKDVIVSVVGTVFLVNAEEEGSRVAVIEGEVRVQQGATTKNLLSGEQLSTNPKMEPLAVKEGVAWSSSAEIHMALLEQVAVALPVIAAQTPAEAKEAFEIISIRPSAPAPAPAGGRQGGPGGCLNSSFQVNPGRLTGTCVTVYRLIDLAYGMKNCPVAVREGPLAFADQRLGRTTFVRSCVSGGPDWTKSEYFDIQATTPQGSPTYTRADLLSGNAVKLQMMIQALLADRFKLTVRRDTKEMPVYNLIVEKPGKIKLSEDQTPPGDPTGARGGPVSTRGGFLPGALPRGALLNCAGNAIEIATLAGCFQSEVDRPVINKTDLKGLYDIPPRPPAEPNNAGGPQVSTLPLALDQLGLKLEPAKAVLDVLVIDRVEKPTEN